MRTPRALAGAGLVLALTGLGGACLNHAAYNALGYMCTTDADCDAVTVCTKSLCAYPIDAGTRPNQLNTGVPVNVTLKQSLGDITLDDGGLYQGLDLGCVKVTAPHVTLKSSRVRCGSFYALEVMDSATDFLASDVEVDGLGDEDDSVGVAGSGMTLERLDVHGVNRGIQPGERSTIRDSFIHDLVGPPVSGIYSNGGEHITIQHNDVEMPHQPSYVIYADNTYGDVSYLLVDSNWLNGGQTTVRVGSSDSSDMKVTDNRFGSDFTGAPDPLQLFGGASAVDNVWDADGGAISYP